MVHLLCAGRRQIRDDVKTYFENKYANNKCSLDFRLYGEPQNYVFSSCRSFPANYFIDLFYLAILLPHFRLFDDTFVNCGLQIFTKSRPRVYE